MYIYTCVPFHLANTIMVFDGLPRRVGSRKGLTCSKVLWSWRPFTFPGQVGGPTQEHAVRRTKGVRDEEKGCSCLS